MLITSTYSLHYLYDTYNRYLGFSSTGIHQVKQIDAFLITQYTGHYSIPTQGNLCGI